MAGRPKSQIGDSVFFPKCGVYPLISGNPLWVNSFRPQCCIGDKVACPGGATVITGDSFCTISGIPTSGIGDKCFGKKCKIGIIITGSFALSGIW